MQMPAGTGPMADTDTVNAAPTDTNAGLPPVAEAGVNQGVNEGAPIGPLPLLKEKVVIQFNFNSNEIEHRAYAVLNGIAQYLEKHPGQRVILKGYTDSSGSSSYNETVSNFRANAVKSYLIAKGVKAESLMAQALGDSDPIASNETVAGRRKNRRVEIEFVKKQ
jgi:outer membrane protein OmpA-like peptidoglycan-associated protein